MLDKKTTHLLKQINNTITDDTYKIIDIALLLSFFKKRHKVTEDVLKDMFINLQKRNYIDIKYFDSDVYCFAIKNKGRLHFEEESKEAKTILKLKRLFMFYVFLAMLMSFIGAWLAIMIFK